MVLYDDLSQGASNLPQLEDLDFILFDNFLELLVNLRPLEVECHTVSHLKALTCGIKHASGHGHGSTFTGHYTHLKTLF